MGPGGNWIEVQIRSQRMNDIAEKGLAAHWKYKTGEQEESDLDKWFKSIKEMLDTSDFTNAVEFMDTFKLNLYSTEIFVFTPKGDIRKMPARSTALDFAFHLHSDIGSHCIGAKVDHRLVPISYELQSGDQIEILTSKSQKPQMEWLDFCTTGKAKAQLRTILKKELKAVIKRGQDAIEEAINSVGQPVNNQTLQIVLDHFKITNANNLYSAVGNNKIDISVIPSLFLNKTKNKWMRIWKLQFGSSDNKKEETPTQPTQHNPKKTLHITDADVGSGYKIADCCHPIPGDAITAFVDDNNNVIVHKKVCEKATALASVQGGKILNVKWTKHNIQSFLTRIALRGIDRMGIVTEITKYITLDLSVNIRKIHFQTHDGIFEGYIDLYVHDVQDLETMIQTILKVKGVDSAVRTDAKDND
jgi:GTP pyrophosphokinase